MGIRFIVLLSVLVTKPAGADFVAIPTPLAPCEKQMGADPLITLLLHLNSSSIPLSPDVQRDLIDILDNGFPSELPPSFREINPVVVRVLKDLVARSANKEMVAQWIFDHILREKRQEVRRRKASTETVGHFVTPRFIEIKGGHIRAPGSPHRDMSTYMDLHLPYDFEVMDVPVTQMMWMKEMGSLPSSSTVRVENSELKQIVVDGQLVTIAPDHPVTGARVDLMMEFANRLSIKKGLRPAYTLTPFNGITASGNVIGHHVRFTEESFSKIEGYRLPADFEWNILVLNAHHELNGLSERDQIARLLQWGWFGEGAKGIFKAVGQKEPIWHSSGGLFDLFGLTMEATHCSYGPPDPQNANRIMSGRDGLQERINLKSLSVFESINRPQFPRPDRKDHWGEILYHSRADIGLRLVRTLRKIK